MAGFQVKVVLEGTKPPLWRRILLPDHLSFADLHDILQIVFGWEEEHLHDFSFQNSRARISNTDYADADMDEREVAADAYLRKGWIRYTYDFGDIWEHKITLEKEMDDYDKRYPVVLTHRRNNMEEDSGGVWDGAESSEPYDEAAVNIHLKETCFCEPLANGESPELEEERELLQLLWNKFSKGQKKQPPKKKSDLERKLEKINSFYEAADRKRASDNAAGQPKDIRRPGEGQLVFNFDTGKTDVEKAPPDYCIYKCDRDITQEQLLEENSEQQMADYAKYLLIPASPGRSKNEAKKAILTVLEAHPEYYLILMDEITVKTYLLSTEKKAGEVLGFVPEKSMVTLCAWGLWDVQIFKSRENNRMEVAVAKGNESFVQFLRTARLHQFFSTKQLITDGIFYLLQSYGFMELGALHAKYQKAFGPISYEDLMRYLYLDGRFYAEYITGECLIDNSATSFAAVNGLDPEQVLAQMSEFGQDLEYADFKNRQLLKWKEGIGSFVPEWDKLADTLVNLDVVYPEELSGFLPDLYLDTLSGLELDELLYIIENTFIEGPEERRNMLALAMIWIDVAACWLNTPLACLKGYSRVGLSRRTGREAFSIAVEEEEYINPEELEGDEQIYELPWKMQQELYYLLSDHSSKKGCKLAAEGVRKLAQSVGKEMQIFEVLEALLTLE
nr:plasmid pRiA4b ORF-3 family protein [uncultured Eisenbergiella sp.]